MELFELLLGGTEFGTVQPLHIARFPLCTTIPVFGLGRSGILPWGRRQVCRKRGPSGNVRRQSRLLLLLLSQSRLGKEIVACGGRTRRVRRRRDGGHVSVGIHFIDNRHFEPWMREDFADGEPFGWVVLQHTTDQIACLCFTW